MWIEALRIALLVFGGGLAVCLALRESIACRFYGRAMVEGRDGAAGLWAFVAAGAGHSSTERRPDMSDRLA
jgi:hypothetical protein